MADSANILEQASERFASLGLTPYVASELEFYLEDCEEAPEGFFNACYEAFGSEGILTYEFEDEAILPQYEISLLHLPDPIVVADNTSNLKEIIKNKAQDFDINVNFNPKPFKRMPGSGFHIHVNLQDKEGNWIYGKAKDEEETDALRYSIGGLCATMAESMIFFAPNEESYRRFSPEFYNGLRPCYSNAPINVSWGGNNRTAAIRIPTSTINPDSRHIEHRVSGADADPHLVIAAILEGLRYGIENQIDPSSGKLWGNAFDPQYSDLLPLPKSLSEAQKAYENGKIIQKALSC